ncbi:MAG TPA: HlyD family efflux transporter periplasmic adaptor subunit [Pirellulales bacterium]|nr:HlyD family efflux transporter periplasmic adaptor subunit [Pirellulales bacterium]
MLAPLWFLSAALVLTGPDGDDSQGRRPANEFEVDAVIVKLHQIEVAAEEAGVITELNVQEGAEVKKDDKLAQISDSKVQAAKRVAQAELEVALAEATNDISVRFAAAAAKVAEYDYEAHRVANVKAPGSTPEAEMKKLLLQAHKGNLETEKAQLELDVAKLTAKAKQAAVEAADEDILRRLVLARTDALVTEVHRRVGEWVNPGDPILKIVRMNKVRVEGTLEFSDVSPMQVVDRPVTVSVTLTRKRTVELPGKIVFVAPKLIHGKYHIIAEVENREERGAWVLLDGMTPRMTVDAGVAAEKVKTPRR